MRLVLGATVITLVAAACQAVDSDPDPGPVTTTTERLEVLDVTVTTRPSVIPRDDSVPATGLRVARHATTTTSTSTTTTSTTSTTSTTLPAKPLVPFPDIPPLTVFESAEDKAVHVVSDPYTIDPDTCEGIIWTTAGSDWSFFVVAAATADGFCEVWIGGQVDNPDYSGNPNLYCLLPKDHPPVTVASDANSDWVSEPGLCGPTGFDQG